MPRAFLITHRRYNGTEEFGASGRDFSPERGVSVAEYGGGQPTSDGVSDCGSETSSECPEELYNLTKLAEVSLAAAAGTLIHPSKALTYQGSLSPRWTHHHHHHREGIERSSSHHTNEPPSPQNLHQIHHPCSQNVHYHDDVELSLRERTRLFFERIESEREILEERNQKASAEVLKVTRSSQDPSPLRSHLEDESSRLPGSPAKSFLPDLDHEESRKDIGLSSPKKNDSSHCISSSEGSKSDDSEDHECPDCGKKYSTSSNLARHRQTHRSLGDKKARRCPHCDKIYVSMPAYSMHVRTHNQGCKCHYCGKCFSRPWLLQGHIRTHTGEKPFKCTICNKAFADKSNLRAHVQTHSNTKPHVCGRCGKAFALKSYLYKHEESSCMRAHHRVTPDKREGMNDSSESIRSSSSTTSPSGKQVQSSPVTSSPTSVIVQRPGTSPTAFSTIIRHTNNQIVAPEATPAPPTKRQCRVDRVSATSEEKPNKPENEDTNIRSRMVIRTSVISPNPEHLVRLGGPLNVKKTAPFDYADPTRPSAFTRPTAISLNLAIA